MMVLGTRSRISDLWWLCSPPSFYHDCKKVHEFADHYVSLALQNAPLEKFSKSGKQKYVFLHELTRETQDPIELRAQLLHLLLAGRDTTAGLLGWTFYLLARHPKVFDRLRREVVDAFGSYQNPKEISFETLKNCSYLQHVLSEALRLFPSVPGNCRIATCDTTLPRGGGPDGLSPLFIKEGDRVYYVVYIMHRRKDIWGEDANEFRPERWINRKSGWEFLPFNGGPRICLGQQFALTNAGFVVTRMLQRFDAIENLDDDPVAKHELSVTTAPVKIPVRLHMADL